MELVHSQELLQETLHGSGNYKIFMEINHLKKFEKSEVNVVVKNDDILICKTTFVGCIQLKEKEKKIL